MELRYKKRYKTCREPMQNRNPPLSVITLKENEIKTSTKRQKKRGRMVSKNMIQSYAIYKRLTLHSKVGKVENLEIWKKYSMQTLIKTQVDCLY